MCEKGFFSIWQNGVARLSNMPAGEVISFDMGGVASIDVVGVVSAEDATETVACVASALPILNDGFTA